MKAYFRYFGVLALLLLGLFLAQRHLFLAFGHSALQGVPARDVLLAHWHALGMDLSTTGYVLLVAVVISIPLLFVEVVQLRTGIRCLLMAFIVLSALVNVVDIGLFDAWGVKIDRKALSYLRYPGEVLGAVSAGRAALLLLVALVQCLLFIFLLNKIDHGRNFRTGSRAGRIGAALVVPLLCVVALRGGPQDDPINKSWSWFSAHPVLNLAALNSMWNALETLVEPAEFTANPYAYMPAEEAELIFLQGRSPAGRPEQHILSTERPNILMILLESWTADVIEPLGGESGVTPAFLAPVRRGPAAFQLLLHRLPHGARAMRAHQRFPLAAHHHHHPQVREVRPPAQPGAQPGQGRILLALLLCRRCLFCQHQGLSRGHGLQ